MRAAGALILRDTSTGLLFSAMTHSLTGLCNCTLSLLYRAHVGGSMQLDVARLVHSSIGITFSYMRGMHAPVRVPGSIPTRRTEPSVSRIGPVAGRLKRQRLLVAAGFVIATLCQGAQSWAVSYGAPGSYGWSNQIFGTAFMFGYGVLAWASWVWFRWIEDLPTPGVSLSRVLKLSVSRTLPSRLDCSLSPTTRRERQLR